MTFDELAANFRNSPSSIDAVKLLYRGAYELMKTEVDNAGLYFVIGVAGQSFVRSWDDQELTVEFLDKSKSEIEGLLDTLLRALHSEPAEKLRLLGQAATEYEWHIKGF